MSEKPILFSAPMVQAILAGRKTMTRRVKRIGRFGNVTDPWQVGTQLWVKEGLAKHNNCVVYAAQYPDKCVPVVGPDPDMTAIWQWQRKTLPGMFMPRWASRITLTVTAVRCERLQEITGADAIAEGIHPLPMQSADDPSAWFESSAGKHQSRTAVGSYQQLWEAINGKGSWESNEWVWVIDFERSKP